MAFYATIKATGDSRGVAQLVEHWSPKPGVASSSLAAPAIMMITVPAMELFFIYNI